MMIKKKDKKSQQLEIIPGVGKSMAEDLQHIGVPQQFILTIEFKALGVINK